MKVHDIITLNEAIPGGAAALDYLARLFGRDGAKAIDRIASATAAKGSKLSTQEIESLGIDAKYANDPKILAQAEKQGLKQIERAKTSANIAVITKKFGDVGTVFKWAIRLGLTVEALMPLYDFADDYMYFTNVFNKGDEKGQYKGDAGYRDRALQQSMSVAVGKLSANIVSLLTIKSLGKGMHLSLLGGIVWLKPFISGLTSYGAYKAMEWWTTGEGSKWLAEAMCNEYVSPVAGAIPLSIINRFTGLFPSFNKQGKEDDKDDDTKTTEPQQPTNQPATTNPAKSANSYNALNQYAPISQGVAPASDRSKWKDIGSGMIQDPVTGTIDFK